MDDCFLLNATIFCVTQPDVGTHFSKMVGFCAPSSCSEAELFDYGASLTSNVSSVERIAPSTIASRMSVVGWLWIVFVSLLALCVVVVGCVQCCPSWANKMRTEAADCFAFTVVEEEKAAPVVAGEEQRLVEVSPNPHEHSAPAEGKLWGFFVALFSFKKNFASLSSNEDAYPFLNFLRVA